MAPWHKIKKLFVEYDQAPRRKGREGREKRVAIRRSQRHMQAFLWSDRMIVPREGSIRNRSATGARMDLYDGGVKSHLLTGNLALCFPADNQEIDCQVVWRAGRSIGLRLVGPYREPLRRYSK